MTEELINQVKVVAQAREHKAYLADLKKTRLEEWEEEHAGLLNDLKENSEFLNEAETKLRELTLKAYEENGDKTPADGVSVKIFHPLEYDPKEALKWAMEHQIALSLDKKIFEGFAGSTPMDFVTIKDEARAQIATSSAAGKFQLQMMGAFAEFERNLISERTKEALKYAKNVGKRGVDKRKRKKRGVVRAGIKFT